MAPLQTSVQELLESLDYSVHPDEGGLLAQRRILGNDTTLYVRCGTTLIGGMFRSHLERFIEVRDKFPTVTMRLVLEELPAEAFLRTAAENRIGVFTRTGFFNDLLDAAKIARQILDDERIKTTASHYVEQTLRSESGELLPHTSSSFVVDDWLADPTSRLLVILAPAGHGKTSLTRVLGRRLAHAHQENPDLPVPLLVPFAEYRTLQDFRGLILRRLEDARVMFTSAAFQHLLGEGRAVLILDGFDELSEEAGYEVSKHNLRQLSEHIAGSGAKVLITSRSVFFRTSRELSDAILRHFASEDITLVELAEFDHHQQRSFLERSGEYDARQIDRITGRINADPSLRALAGSPLLLSLIGPSAVEGTIASRPELYRRFVNSIFERERERYGYSLSDDEQRSFLLELAQDMYKDNTYVYDKDDLITYFVDPVIEDAVAIADDTAIERVRLQEKLGDHALLDSVGGGSTIQFRHPSFRDYFVAERLAEALRNRDASTALGVIARRRFPDNLAGFLSELLDAESVAYLSQLSDHDDPARWNSIRLATEYASREAREDGELATVIFKKGLGGTLDFTRQDLREQQFHRLAFDGASFRGANLEDTVFERCSLEGCDFSGATLKQTSLLRCKLTGCHFDVPSALVSIKIQDGADLLLETSRNVRQWLHDQGGIVDTSDLIITEIATPRERAEELVQHVLRKFYPVGSRFWDVDLNRESILHGLNGEERGIVSSEVMPALRGAEIINEKRERGKTLITFNAARKPDIAAYLDDGRPTPEVTSVIDRVAVSLST